MRLETLRNDGLALKSMEDQTHEMCLIAVGQNSEALQYVKNQTDEICLVAVMRDGEALQYVKNQTEEICLAAVNKIGRALGYVENQTDEICLAAVKKNGWALQYVKNQTEEICFEAVRKNGAALIWVKEQTEAICLAAVKNTTEAIRYAKNQTEEMCLIAVNANAGNFIMVDPRHFTYNAEIINACYAGLKESWSGISKGPVGLYKRFFDKLSDVLGELGEEELINAVDVELNHIFNDDVIKHHEDMFNIKQKVSMLKSSFNGKINLVDKKPKII